MNIGCQNFDFGEQEKQSIFFQGNKRTQCTHWNGLSTALLALLVYLSRDTRKGPLCFTVSDPSKVHAQPLWALCKTWNELEWNGVEWNGINQRQSYHISYTDIKMYRFEH